MPTTMETPRTEYLTVRQVAEMLETPYTTVLDWIKAGTFPAYRHGGRWKVKRTEMEAWEQSQKNIRRQQ